jgi:hypothetical protein
MNLVIAPILVLIAQVGRKHLASAGEHSLCDLQPLQASFGLDNPGHVFVDDLKVSD